MDNLTPIISHQAFEKAGRAIRDFFKYYVHEIHGISFDEILEQFPTYYFVHALVYEMDYEHEINSSTRPENLPRLIAMRDYLLEFFSKHRLLDGPLEDELNKTLEFCELEAKLCSGEVLTEAEILRAIQIKSMDYRILHRLFFKLQSKPYDEDLFGILQPLEMLIEVEYDLAEYEEDVSQNIYNTYRAFERLYAEEAPQKMKQYLAALEEEVCAPLPEELLELTEKYNLSGEIYPAEIRPAYSIPPEG